MKALLIGNGAREHCIAESLVNSDSKLFALMKYNNIGISRMSSEYYVGSLNPENSVKCAEKWSPDFAVIGPEAPLALGVADALRKKGIPVLGPDKKGAMIETSKGFARKLLSRHGIDANPNFKLFYSLKGIKEYLSELQDYVLKPDGLTGGKGVKVKGEHFTSDHEAINYCAEVIKQHGSVVVEEKLIGQEFSVQFFVDGKNIAAMPAAQDHKRAFEGDKGANTGGMGSYSFPGTLPFLTQSDLDQATRIANQTVSAMISEGIIYQGILYGGFIAVKDGVKLIEYNARFADPECMNVIPLIKNNFSELCADIAEGKLKKVDFEKKATVCKYVVPRGYPDNPVSDARIRIGDSHARVYYASVYEKDGSIYTTKSRTAAFLGIHDDIEHAEKIAQQGVESAFGELYYRRDIGTSELIKKRIEHMKFLRG